MLRNSRRKIIIHTHTHTIKIIETNISMIDEGKCYLFVEFLKPEPLFINVKTVNDVFI